MSLKINTRIPIDNFIFVVKSIEKRNRYLIQLFDPDKKIDSPLKEGIGFKIDEVYYIVSQERKHKTYLVRELPTNDPLYHHLRHLEKQNEENS